MNDLKATDDDEYETIKKNAVFRKENELYTPRMYESKGRLDNVERHKNKTRTELILE